MQSKTEVLQQLAQIAEQNPDVVEAVLRENPEWRKVFTDEVEVLRLTTLAHQDSPEGFFAYYEGKYGFPPPPQAQRWVRKIYEGHEQNLGFTLNGHRGSRKTVTISICFLEYRIGLEPWKTNLVVRASDITANEITDKVTMTIKFHPWWKLCFPNVVPDEEGKWSTNGYWVIDTSMPHEEWVKKTSGTADPTLVGGGYTSQKINGKHPSGVCLTDDLHGINNSSSETERKAAVKFYTTELAKTFIRQDGNLITWVINIGVPWGKDDTHQTLSKSGGFVSETYPVMKRAQEGDEGAVYIDGVNKQLGVVYEDIKGWWILNSPTLYGVDDIIRDRGLGKFDFHQMMMMDLNAAKSGSWRYYTYPHAEIDRNWVTAGGVDIPYEFKERMERDTKLSSFAMSFYSKNPKGGAVVVGGYIGQPTIGKAFLTMLDAQTSFPNWKMCLCESAGGGRVFRESAKLMYPQLDVMSSDLGKLIRQKGESGGKAKNKKTRLETELYPWIENGVIKISDERTPYLDILRDAMDNFSELDENRADERLDALDALYHAAKFFPDVLIGRYEDELPTPIRIHQKSPLEGRLALRRNNGR